MCSDQSILKTQTNIHKLLVLDPEKRISLEDVETHPWIVKHCKGSSRAYDRVSGGKFRSSSERES